MMMEGGGKAGTRPWIRGLRHIYIFYALERNVSLDHLALLRPQGPSQLPASILFSHSDHNLVIYDAFPKSIFHFLILPRVKAPHTAAELSSLRVLLKGDRQRAKDVVDRLRLDAEELKKEIEAEMLKRYGCKWDIWCGFHAVQSMEHMHLHVLSADLVSEKMKHKKHYNSFHPKRGFFLHLNDVLDWFEAEPSFYSNVTKLSPSKYEPLLKEPLACFDCDAEMKNMPTLKSHLKEEWDKRVKAGKVKEERRKKLEGKTKASGEKRLESDANKSESSADSKKQLGGEGERLEEGAGDENNKHTTGNKRPSAEPVAESKDAQPSPQKRARTRLRDPDPDWEF
ncbi:HIT-like domain-containing protein [Schizophyllum amplum]|uniref:HIT-like domain-containing protein n=1 Tax=Schizophyllum amplum TaxID=97359 RepID=A0A550C1F0_9AGAR|nr:HIT-like domain-containing protein [Auriculariopsis ampla]